MTTLSAIAITAGQEAARRIAPVGMIIQSLWSPLASDGIWKPLDGAAYPKANYAKLFQAIGQIYTYTEPAVAGSIVGSGGGIQFFGKVGAYWFLVFGSILGTAQPEIWYANDPTGAWTKVSLTSPVFGTSVSILCVDIVFNGVEYLAGFVGTFNSAGQAVGMALYKSTNGTVWATAGASWRLTTANAANTLTSGVLIPFSGGGYFSCANSNGSLAVKYTNGGTSITDAQGANQTLGTFLACDASNVYYLASSAPTTVVRKAYGASAETLLSTSGVAGNWFPLATAGAWALVSALDSTTSQILLTTDSFATIQGVLLPDLPGYSYNGPTLPGASLSILDVFDDAANGQLQLLIGYLQVGYARLYVVNFNKTTYATSLRGYYHVAIGAANSTIFTLADGVITCSTSRSTSYRQVVFSFNLDATNFVGIGVKNLASSAYTACVYTPSGAWQGRPSPYNLFCRGPNYFAPRYYAALGKTLGINNSTIGIRTYTPDYDTTNYFRLPVMEPTLAGPFGSTGLVNGYPTQLLIKTTI